MPSTLVLPYVLQICISLVRARLQSDAEPHGPSRLGCGEKPTPPKTIKIQVAGVPQVLMCRDTELAPIEAGMREALGEGEPFDLELDPPDGATFMGQMVGMALMGLANSQLREIPGEFDVGIPPAEPDQATGPPHEPTAAGGPHVDPVRAWLAAM